jgi:EmrB/QacA subfamily drug resistance transporter
MPSLHRITAADLHDRRWELLAITSVGAFMGPLDGSIVGVALPTISADLRLSFGESMWVQAAYLLAMAVLLIPMGSLADRGSRVRFYQVGIALFTLGSLLCAVSMNGSWLIVSRVVQACGAALAVTMSTAIVTSVFPPQERGKAIGLNVMAVYLGLSVGPPLGGLLADTLGWRWIFLVNLPVGAIVLIWGWLLLPRDAAAKQAPRRPDVAGAALLAAFLVCLLVPLTFAPEWGWTSPGCLALLLLSGVALIGLIVTELRVRDPVLDLDLLMHNRLFAFSNLAALLNYMALYGASILTAVFLQIVQGRSAALSGWLLLSQPLMQAVLSPFAGRLSDRTGARLPSTIGMVLVATGLVTLGAMPADAGIAQVMIGLGIAGVGLAAFSAPNASAIMGSVGRDQLGAASGFLATMRVTGQALSIAVLGGIAASQLGRVGAELIFRHHLAPGGKAQSASIVDGFVQGYRLAMFTGAGLALLAAVASLTRGRQRIERAPAARLAEDAAR